MSSKLSTTTVATPASSAIVSSAVVLALPCRYIRSGRTPAARAMTSSPAPATSMLSPSAANTWYAARQGNDLEANTTSESGWRAARPSRIRRA